MSTDRRRRSRAEQQAETRARLLDAAAAEFAAHGFEGASIDAITQHAGYSRGAFYSNFDDKASLLLELSGDQMARFAQTALPALLATTEPDRIAEGARYLLEEAPAIEILLLVELARLRTTHDDVGAVLDQLTSRSLEFVDEVLTAARPTETAAGETGDPERGGSDASAADDRTTATHAVLAAVLGLMLLRHLGIDVDQTVAERLLTGALTPTDPPSQGRS